MEYWNNPLINIAWPGEQDPIADSLHNGNHCVFYNPAVNKHDIHNTQTLQNLCDWVNAGIAAQGWRKFLSDSRNHDHLANLVKLNLWVWDLPVNGSVKPMLLTYTGGKYNADFNSGTGASRLCAMERIPSMTTVAAFITTSVVFKSQFANLEEVTTFDRFAELCQAVPGQHFLFRLTDPDAPFGIDWYEYDSAKTASVTPSESACLAAIDRYMIQHPNTVFAPDWFESLITWDYS